jgi:hypothetical protein
MAKTASKVDKAATGEMEGQESTAVTDPAHQQVATTEQLAPPATGQVVTGEEAMQDLMRWCVGYAERTDEDEWAAMARSVETIMRGESAEEVLTASMPIQGQDLCNRPGKRDKETRSAPFQLLSFELTATEFDQGWPFYANMSVQFRSGGDVRVVNCGGVKVVAALRKLHELDALPRIVELTRTRTRAGTYVLALEDPWTGVQ